MDSNKNGKKTKVLRIWWWPEISKSADLPQPEFIHSERRMAGTADPSFRKGCRVFAPIKRVEYTIVGRTSQ
jgi:hypothetical protein